MANPTTLVNVQQPQASYNHPCGDLLDKRRRRDYLAIAVPLYRASIEGDWEAAKGILHRNEHLVRHSITEKKEAPLHVAAAGRSTKFVTCLVNMMSKLDLELQDEDGNTAFCIAAISGNVGMVEIMARKNRALMNICGSKNMMPLDLAAFHGHHDMVDFLYDQSDKMTGDGWTDNNRNEVLLKCIEANIFDVALKIMKENEKLPQGTHEWDVLHALARKPSAFQTKSSLELYGSFIRTASKKGKATPLLRLVWERIMEKPKDVIDKILRGPMIKVYNVETYPSQILFIAAQMNNRGFLVELIREYPDLIWKTNDNGQTIFHISVSHRHVEVSSLLSEIGSAKDLIAPMTDQQGNNILHLVGKKAEINAYDDWGTLTRMFREFLWYKEVEHILPPRSREMKNIAGQTPQELFIKNHEKLVSDGIKSLNATINISMVVAALVCTIAFSVVFQIPGGFNQDNGFPMFLHNTYYVIFVVLDASSFIFATSSIFNFLSITLSSHQGDIESLIKKWVIGQVTLLESIMFVVCAFFISFFILYRKSIWMYIIYIVAYPVIMAYVFACLSVVLDATRATYGSRYLFKQKKHTLYHKI